MASEYKQYNKRLCGFRGPTAGILIWHTVQFAAIIVVVVSGGGGGGGGGGSGGGDGVEKLKSTESQVAASSTVDPGDRSVYPDYCWFDGLENRILMEYPDLYEEIKLHDAALYKDKNYFLAADLHRKLFKRIYELELANLLAIPDRPNGGADKTDDPAIDDNEHKAAYKLFDLWANTPGDFERRNNEYNNYLEPYLMESHIEFWSYCLDDRADCHTILDQLMVLARDQELGPIELLQVSTNIIMLMNSHKADLVLEKLTSRHVVDLNELNSGDSSGGSGHDDSSADEDANYEKALNNLVELIEKDENFNEATFHYVFTNTDEIHKIIDPKIESYIKHEITKFTSGNGNNASGKPE